MSRKTEEQQPVQEELLEKESMVGPYDKVETLVEFDEPETPTPTSQQESWSTVLATGIDIIAQISQVIQQPSSQRIANPLIDNNRTTGESYIKIPLPDQDILKKVAEAASPLLDLLQQRLKK